MCFLLIASTNSSLLCPIQPEMPRFILFIVFIHLEDNGLIRKNAYSYKPANRFRYIICLLSKDIKKPFGTWKRHIYSYKNSVYVMHASHFWILHNMACTLGDTVWIHLIFVVHLGSSHCWFKNIIRSRFSVEIMYYWHEK